MTAAAVVAACALAACGPVQMGAAAIAGSQRVSTSELTTQVANLQDTLNNSNGKVPLQFKQSQEPQQVLGWLLRFQVRDEMAARNHVTVTPAQSQRALASIAAQASQGGSGKVPLDQLAAANGLPPDLLPDLGRYQAIQDQIVAQLDGGTLPSSQSDLQALGKQFSREQCIAAKSMDIKVNPQFGAFDYGQLSVVPATTTLAAPQTPSPAPTPKPQLSPPC
jgi:SurA-like protein